MAKRTASLIENTEYQFLGMQMKHFKELCHD